MNSKITITQIAEKAGVSRGTVDKVLHERAGISEKVRKKVQRVIDELDYKPNPVARALKSTGNPIRLAVVIPKIDNPFFEKIKLGMDEAMNNLIDFGVNIDYFYSDNINLPELMSLLDYIAESNYDGIALRAMESSRLREKLDCIAKKGIPIAIYDSNISNCNTLCFVGEDPLKSGRIAGSLMCKILPADSKILIVGGSSEFEVHRLRQKGFLDVILPYGLIVTENFDALEQQTIAYNRTKDILCSGELPEGIFVVAGCATDVGQALIDTNLSGKIKLICYNYSADSVEMIKNGTIDFAVSTGPQSQGEHVVSALFEKLFYHKDPPDHHIVTLQTIITEDLI